MWGCRSSDLLLLLLLPQWAIGAAAECEVDASGNCIEAKPLPVTYTCPTFAGSAAKKDPKEETGDGDAKNTSKDKTPEELIDEEIMSRVPSWNEEVDYANEKNEILTNMTQFLETYRDTTFDTYTYTYEEYKAGMFDFKQKYYSKYLKSGDTLYESASGIGLNLIMTLEILKEQHGIDNLVVYGNDFEELSVLKSKKVIDTLAPPLGSQRGTFCTAGSDDLSFIPENSFDVVYTGYISPALNPLGMRLSQAENFGRYQYLCESEEEHFIYAKEKAQMLQCAWFGLWVYEMTRIAKPGAPIIIEQVAPPYCELYDDWGGVIQDYWKNAAEHNTYKWNVDPASVIIEQDTLHNKRYHVVMIKKTQEEMDKDAAAKAKNMEKQKKVFQKVKAAAEDAEKNVMEELEQEQKQNDDEKEEEEEEDVEEI